MSTGRLLGIILAAWLVPQVAALAIVAGIAAGSAYDSVRNFLQLEIVPDAGAALIALWARADLGWINE